MYTVWQQSDTKMDFCPILLSMTSSEVIGGLEGRRTVHRIYRDEYLVPCRQGDFLLNKGHTFFLLDRYPHLKLINAMYQVREAPGMLGHVGSIRVPPLVVEGSAFRRDHEQQQVLLVMMDVQFRQTPLDNMVTIGTLKNDDMSIGSPYYKFLQRIQQVEMVRAEAAQLVIDALAPSVSETERDLVNEIQGYSDRIKAFKLPTS